MRKLASLCTVLMLFCTLAFGQTRTVTGKVTDELGNPVPFASITETGTKNATIADANGDYSLKINEGSQLTFSSSGFITITVSPGAGDFIVSLKSSGQLAEVIVTTALGQVRQAKELGYSTARIKGAELTQAKVVNLQNGLTGKVSGLNVQTVDNGVFGETRLTLRGIRSLTGNNQPMLILDGVPIALGFISSVNPNDVQEVTILKSASATAVYGPDGVNGAIIITTKRGSKSRPVISVGHTIQVERVSYMPKLQTRFGSGSSVDIYGYGVYDPIENQGYGDEFDGSVRQIGRDAPDGSQYTVEYIPRPQEKRKFWNTGITNQTDVSFSTGDFYLSAQNVNIQGIMPKDVNRRISLHMAANKEFDKFKASYSFNYTRSNYDINVGSSFGNGRDYTVYWNVINTPMQIPLTRFKDWRNDYWSSPDGYFNDYYHNPYWVVDNFRGVGKNDDFFGNVELNYKATSWLSFTYRLGGTVSNAIAKNTQGAYNYTPFTKNSGKATAQSNIAAAVADASAYSSRITSEFFVNFKKSVKAFSFDALVGQSFRESTSKSINVSSNNLGIPSVYNTSVRKGEPGASESNQKTRLERFFGKLTVGYNNWVFGEFTSSYDIDSRLANPYNFQFQDISFFYPGSNVSVLLHEIIPGVKGSVVSYMKLRGALSKTGNVNLGAYSLENTFSQTGGFPYGTILGFSSDNTIRKDKYTPEFVINKEVGIELGFLKNRISLEATAYSQDNTDQIITVAYSASTGYPAALLNAASFTNKGLEFDLRLTPLVKIGDVNIDFKANYSYQTNEVTKLIEGVDELGIGNGNYVIVGESAYTFKLTDYARDDQGRVIVNAATGFPTVDPAVKKFGITQPKHLLGLSLNADWKGFTFSAVADYRSGNQIYAGNLGSSMDFSGISYRSGQNARQPFVFPNSVYYDGTKYVENTNIYTPGGYTFWSVAVNTSANSNYIASGAFWKLREVSLGYSLPARMFKNKSIKGINLSLTGRNLFMWLPKTNEWTDPEFSNTTGNAQGVSGLDNTPPTRIFGFNVTAQL